MSNRSDLAEYEFKWQHLVDEMVENGGDVVAASAEAGYADVRGAYRALKEAHVQEALVSGLRRRLARLGPAAMQSLLNLSQSARSEKVRLDAALAVLDRLGVQPVDAGSQVRIGEVNITVDLSSGGVGEKSVPLRGHPLTPPNFSSKPEDAEVITDAKEVESDG